MQETVNVAVQQTQTIVVLLATPTVPPTGTAIPADTPEATESPSSDGGPSTAAASADWLLFQDGAGDFEILLPASWLFIDLSREDDREMFGKLLANNPQLSGRYSGEAIQSLREAGIKLYALDASEMPTSLNLISTDLGMTFSLDDYVRFNLDQLAQVYGKIEIFSQIVTLGDAQALEARYQAPVPGPDGMIGDAALVQYLLLANTRQYVLTFAGPAEAVSAGYDTFLKIAQSFRPK